MDSLEHSPQVLNSEFLLFSKAKWLTKNRAHFSLLFSPIAEGEKHPMSIMVRAFVNGLENWGLIPSQLYQRLEKKKKSTWWLLV